MKIDRIEVYGYDLSYRYGKYVMSGNQVINSIPSTVVRILTDSGIKGWGKDGKRSVRLAHSSWPPMVLVPELPDNRCCPP